MQGESDKTRTGHASPARTSNADPTPHASASGKGVGEADDASAGYSQQADPTSEVSGSRADERDVRLVAAIRGVVAFALVWAVLSVASWLFVPKVEGTDADWVVPWTAVLLFVVAVGVGWIEFVRSGGLRRG